MDIYDRLELAGRIARNMAELYDETDDNNPEYYRGMEELGAYLIGGDPELARNLINAMFDLAKEEGC